MPQFETTRFSAHYTDTGAGEAIVLLHAGGTSAAHWRKVGPLLDRRYRLIAPDLIGFGETVRRDGQEDTSHDDQANLVRALLAHTADGPVHVVGHSFGGATAMRLAVRYPDALASLTLIEPALTPLLRQAGATELYEAARGQAIAFIDDALAGRETTAWERFLDGHNGAGTWAGLSDPARDRFLAKTRQTVAAYRANLSNRTGLDDLGRLRAPTQVICGTDTNAGFMNICRIIGAAVPDARTAVIAGAGHMSPLTHAADVADLVEAQVLRARFAWAARAA